MYRQVKDFDGTIIADTILRVADGAFIPNDPANRDWREYQEWLKAGNIPLPPE